MGKSFETKAQKTACILIKLAQNNATRNSKRNPATQRKKTARLCGKPAQLATLTTISAKNASTALSGNVHNAATWELELLASMLVVHNLKSDLVNTQE